jgi:preprotein translocase subunit YajC
MGSLIILPIMLVLMYLLVIRPQQRRMREHQALVSSLQVGDEVVSSAGMYGRIVELGDEVITLDVADGVHIRLARAAIGRRIGEPAAEDPAAAGPEAGSDSAGIPDPEE